jgi:hypothetical protein
MKKRYYLTYQVCFSAVSFSFFFDPPGYCSSSSSGACWPFHPHWTADVYEWVEHCSTEFGEAWWQRWGLGIGDVDGGKDGGWG